MPEPRVAFAWDVFGNGKTAVKGSFGLHRALLDTLDYRLDQTAPFNTTLSYSNTTVSKLPELSTSAATGGLVSPSNVQRNIETPTVLAWTLRVEQEIAPSTSLSVGYVGSHGYHQILSEDQNTPPSVVCPAASCPASLPAGTVYYTTTKLENPNLANSTSWVSQGISNYNALEVDVRRRYVHGLQLRGVYTWSKNLDDGSAWNTSVSANTPAYVSFPGNPKVDYGVAATNISQAAAINGTWELPLGQGHALFSDVSSAGQQVVAGWSLSGIATLQSGFPFSPQLGYNPTGNGDSRNPVRPQINPDYHSSLYPKTAVAVVQSQCIHGALSGDVRECRPRFSERAKSGRSGYFRWEGDHDPRAFEGAVPRGVLQYSESHQFHYSKPGSLQQRPNAIEAVGSAGDFPYRRAQSLRLPPPRGSCSLL